MKKLLLVASTMGLAVLTQAQARLSIYEEFSGENCAPCASANPGLWTLMSANLSKAILVKYQSPIPSAGPIYLAYTTVTDTRMSYYTVPFAPYGRLNGTGLGTGTAAPTSPGHVANLLQADIDAATAAGSPFNMTVTASYNSTGDSVFTTVKIDCVSAYAPAGGSLKLRVGMIEHLVYAVAPGTNGEKDFHNVVREMYPNAAGTTIPNAWTVGMTQTFTVAGKVRPFVTKTNAPSMVAWIQNETDKAIPQAAESAALPKTFPNNLTAAPATFTPKIFCTGGSATTVNVVLKNSGTSATPITAATIWYRVGTGTWASKAWTGSLASGATTSVPIGPIAMPATAGTYVVTDSVVLTGVDNDILDNVASTTVTVVSTAPKGLPYSNDFEAAAFPAGYIPYDVDGSGNIWVNGSGGAGSTYCHSGIYMPWFKLSSYATGTVSMLVMPTPAISGAVALDFWEAYAQTNSSSSDKLEVVYSKDCGVSWIALWSATGAAHATTTPTSTYWLPDRNVAGNWVKRSISLSTLPAGSILAFRATDGGGNNLFIDDVNVRSGTGVTENVVTVNSVEVYPNPASTVANTKFTVAETSNVSLEVIDMYGKVVKSIAGKSYTAGTHEVATSVSDLASGLYMIKVITENGSVTERFSVAK